MAELSNQSALAMLDFLFESTECDYYPIGWASDRIHALEKAMGEIATGKVTGGTSEDNLAVVRNIAAQAIELQPQEEIT